MSYTRIKNIQDYKSSAIKFIRDSCENLRFSEKKDKEEADNLSYLGTSKEIKQIPYNMQMDIDRMCLEVSLERFLDSGRTEDAFDVYFCYLEMYVGEYDRVRSIIEMLSEYEVNGSAVLIKHRDHYVHSVYVFALGLALFETNDVIKSEYKKFYRLPSSKAAAHHFLRNWGLAALFHDVGYPFELPYEQIVSYFQDDNRNGNDPYIVYKNMEKLSALSEENSQMIASIPGYRKSKKKSIEQVLAQNIKNRLGDIYPITAKELTKLLKLKPTDPKSFHYYMDHAYFSAVILFEKLFEEEKGNCNLKLDTGVIDALSAIILHNSTFKHSINSGEIPLKINLFPIAWLLMLCDELQCWDRMSYGRNTRKELYPMSVSIMTDRNCCSVNYEFDRDEEVKYNYYKENLIEWEKCEPKDIKNPDYSEQREAWEKQEPRLKICSDMMSKPGEESRFIKSIEAIVDISCLKLTVAFSWKPRISAKKKTYLSNSSFLHLFDFAVALNARYNIPDEFDELSNDTERFEFLSKRKNEFIENFKQLSLEYKLSLNYSRGSLKSAPFQQ